MNDLFVYCPVCKKSHLKPGPTHQFNLIVDGVSLESIVDTISDFKMSIPMTFQMEGGKKFELRVHSMIYSRINDRGQWIFEGSATFIGTPGSSYGATVLYNRITKKGEVAY